MSASVPSVAVAQNGRKHRHLRNYLLDHHFQLWRYQHMKTVERIIGYKPGTGGTAGVSYLAKALRLRLFPELWEARTSM